MTWPLARMQTPQPERSAATARSPSPATRRPPRPHRRWQALLPSCLLGAACLLPALACLAGPAGPAAEAADWTEANRWLGLSAGRQVMDYRERDTQGRTRDGTLDTEQGSLTAQRIEARWQFNSGWVIDLSGQRASGSSRYDGYLQSGSGLTAYQATSQHRLQAWRATAGYALGAAQARWMPADWQLLALAQYGSDRWQRQLVQYDETYRFDRWALGGQLQWMPRRGSLLEAQALWGRTRPATVRVPALGFQAEQPGCGTAAWQVGLTQDLGVLAAQAGLAGWRLTLRGGRESACHQASPVVAGLQAPPNEHLPSTWMLGAQKHF